MKAIIIDDEVKSQNALKLMLEQHCPEVNVVALCGDADAALVQIKAHRPDLLFVDISMPGKNGFEMLEEMGPADAEIIFVTAHDQYMLKAFKFSAVDYLLKPVHEDDLTEAVSRASGRVNRKMASGGLETFLHNLRHTLQPAEVKLRIPIQTGFEVIALQDIIFCEAESSYTRFHLVGKSQVISSRTIKEYEQMLEDSFFVRVHKSTLINMKHVKKYHRGREGGTIVLSDGTEVSVAKRKKELLLEKIRVYFK